MRPLLLVCLTTSFLFSSVAAIGDEPRSNASGAVFVPMAPCRILDTATKADDSAENSRKVEIRSTRCGQIIPPYATAYAVRLTTTKHSAEKDMNAEGRVVEHQRDVPAAADGRLTFPMPAQAQLAVDVEGYYVAAGTPIHPISGTAASRPGGVVSTTANRPPGTPAVNGLVEGDKGTIYLNGIPDPADGILMTAASTHPWIVAKAGGANASSGIAFANSNNVELMRVRGDGVIRTSSNSIFFDGRTDFFGYPMSAQGGPVAIPTNTVHDVTLVNPLDAAGTNASRLVFFNANTVDEFNSPAITKFRAHTLGFHGQDNTNFHSLIHYPNASQYHFRASATAIAQRPETDTFWVKAGTDTDIYTGVRADMYVSGKVLIGSAYKTATLGAGNSLAVEGNVGIGTTVPTEKLHVIGNIYATGSITGATVVNAEYQDLAEWVPATTNMEPGTVVVLNPDGINEVMPSATRYDTTVAGVVSEQPGLLLGVASASKEMIATTGRVRVKVDATVHPIRVGDLLVTSDQPGMAMKSISVEMNGITMHRPGTIIGKALEPLAGGAGEILVLLSLQ